MAIADRAQLRVATLARGDRAQWVAALRELERQRVYPLGCDTFRIDHGADPFAFFDRQGNTCTVLAADGRQLLGVATAVHRRHGPAGYYLCDLKTRPGGAVGVVGPLVHGLLAAVPAGAPCFGIAMRRGPRMAPLARLVAAGRRPEIVASGLALGPEIRFLTVPGSRWQAVAATVAAQRGATVLVSNRGVKDIVLGSTGHPLPLLHAVWGEDVPAADDVAAPPADAVCMVAVPAGDPLADALAAAGAGTLGSCDAIHRGIDPAAWTALSSRDV